MVLFKSDFLKRFKNQKGTKFTQNLKLNVHKALRTHGHYGHLLSVLWDKVFKVGTSKIYERQPLKNLKGCGLHKVVFHKFYLVHSWILCPLCTSNHNVLCTGVKSNIP